MCKSTQKHDINTIILEKIDAFRLFFEDDTEGVKLVVKHLGVSPKFV